MELCQISSSGKLGCALNTITANKNFQEIIAAHFHNKNTPRLHFLLKWRVVILRSHWGNTEIK